MKKITIHKLGHNFDFSVQEDGEIVCSIDGKIVAVDALVDGGLKFAEKQRIKVNGTLVGIGGLSLSDEELTTLKEAREAAIAYPEEEKEERQDNESTAASIAEPEGEEFVKKSQVTENDVDEEYWQKLWEEREVAKNRVDEWKRTVRSYREKAKKGQKYCVHTFRIGNNKYRFVERQIPGTGIVVNPDYKILDDMPRVGGVPKKYGELMFWDYLFEDKGWQRVRVLTHNEEVCLDIIQNYGFFTFPEDKEKMLKRKKSFFKKSKKKAVKEKGLGIAGQPPAEDNK